MLSNKYAYALLLLATTTSLWARNGLIVEEETRAKLSLPFESIQYSHHFMEYTNPLHKSRQKKQRTPKRADYKTRKLARKKLPESQATVQTIKPKQAQHTKPAAPKKAPKVAKKTSEILSSKTSSTSPSKPEITKKHQEQTPSKVVAEPETLSPVIPAKKAAAELDSTNSPPLEGWTGRGRGGSFSIPPRPIENPSKGGELATQTTASSEKKKNSPTLAQAQKITPISKQKPKQQRENTSKTKVQVAKSNTPQKTHASKKPKKNTKPAKKHAPNPSKKPDKQVVPPELAKKAKQAEQQIIDYQARLNQAIKETQRKPSSSSLENKPPHPASAIETRLKKKEAPVLYRKSRTQIEMHTNEYLTLIQIENLLEHERKSSLENFIEENIEFEGLVINKEKSTITAENSIFGKKALIHPIVGINFHINRDQLEYGYVGQEFVNSTLNNLFPSFGLRNLGLKLKLMPDLHLQTSYYFETSTSKFGKVSGRNTIYQGFETLLVKKDENLFYEFFMVLEATKKLDVRQATSRSFKGFGAQLRYSL